MATSLSYSLTPAERAAPLRDLLNSRNEIRLRCESLPADDDGADADGARAHAYDLEIEGRAPANAADVVAQLQYLAHLRVEGFDPDVSIVHGILASACRHFGDEASEPAEPTTIARLARIRQAADDRHARLDQGAEGFSAEAMRYMRHWTHQRLALGTAIICEPPVTIADAFAVLACVHDMRDLINNMRDEVSPREIRVCSELTTAAIVNCMPILAAAAADLTPEMQDQARWASGAVERREGHRHG